jgi:hypothetical protein
MDMAFTEQSIWNVKYIIPTKEILTHSWSKQPLKNICIVYAWDGLDQSKSNIVNKKLQGERISVKQDE